MAASEPAFKVGDLVRFARNPKRSNTTPDRYEPGVYRITEEGAPAALVEGYIYEARADDLAGGIVIYPYEDELEKVDE